MLKEKPVPASAAFSFQFTIETYQSLFKHLSESLLITDRNFDVLYINEKANDLTESFYNFKFKAGDNLITQLPQDRHRDLKKIHQQLLKGETVVYEVEVPQHTGKILGLRCKDFPIQNEFGEIVAIGILLEDITAEKQLEVATSKQRILEEQKNESRLLFEEFMHNSPIVGWITDEDTVMRYMNPIYLRTYGLAETDFGKSIYDIFPEQMALDYHMNNMKVLKENKPIETIEKGITAEGRPQILKIYKFPLIIGGKRMVAGWGVDISEQVELQEQLTQSIERYHYANEATSDAIYDYEIAKKYVLRSTSFETLFGHEQKKVSIFEHFRNIHPDDKERVKEICFSSLRNSNMERWCVEFRFKDQKGNYRYVLDKAFIKRENGKAVRVTGAFQDITQQKQLQEQLLQQEKKTKREVVRSVIETQEKERRKLSVELHDNINQMIASCKLMLETACANEAVAKTLTRKAYESLNNVIDEIRKLSHDLNPSALEDVGLKEAIGDLVNKINLSGKLSVRFESQISDASTQLKSEDKIAVFRIVQEQLNNILRHAFATEVYIQINIEQSKVHISIKDNGVGFELEKTKKGLGLRNIQNRIEYYNGQLTIESSPGKGCLVQAWIDAK